MLRFRIAYLQYKNVVFMNVVIEIKFISVKDYN